MNPLLLLLATAGTATPENSMPKGLIILLAVAGAVVAFYATYRYGHYAGRKEEALICLQVKRLTQILAGNPEPHLPVIPVNGGENDQILREQYKCPKECRLIVILGKIDPPLTGQEFVDAYFNIEDRREKLREQIRAFLDEHGLECVEHVLDNLADGSYVLSLEFKKK